LCACCFKNIKILDNPTDNPNDFITDVLPIIARFREEQRFAPNKLCRSCPFFQSATQSSSADSHYFLETLSIAASFRCNFACSYCIYANSSTKYPDYHIYPILLALYDKALIAPKVVVSFLGGEPMLFPGLQKIISLILNKSPQAHIALVSNMSVVSDFIVDILNNPAFHIAVLCSLDAASSTTFLKIKGVNAFGQVWSNLRKIHIRDRICLKMVISENNYFEAEQFVLRAINNGFRNLCVDIDLFNGGRPSTNMLARLNNDEVSIWEDFSQKYSSMPVSKNIISGITAFAQICQQNSLSLRIGSTLEIHYPSVKALF
jgi:sulfatase maturation enzyme AslB (radical SAM superfamily)